MITVKFYKKPHDRRHSRMVDMRNECESMAISEPIEVAQYFYGIRELYEEIPETTAHIDPIEGGLYEIDMKIIPNGTDFILIKSPA